MANSNGSRFNPRLSPPSGKVRDGARRSESKRLGCDVANADGDPRDQWWQGHAEEGTGGRDINRSGVGADLADADSPRLEGRQLSFGTSAEIAGFGCAGEMGNTECIRWEEVVEPILRTEESEGSEGPTDNSSVTAGRFRWPPEPDVGRVADGVAHRVDRITALGNGQVPRVAATAWRLLRRRNR